MALDTLCCEDANPNISTACCSVRIARGLCFLSLNGCIVLRFEILFCHSDFSFSSEGLYYWQCGISCFTQSITPFREPGQKVLRKDTYSVMEAQ